MSRNLKVNGNGIAVQGKRLQIYFTLIELLLVTC